MKDGDMIKDAPILGAHKIAISFNTKKELKRIALENDMGVGELMGTILANFVSMAKAKGKQDTTLDK